MDSPMPGHTGDELALRTARDTTTPEARAPSTAESERTCPDCGTTWTEASPGAVGCPACYQRRQGSAESEGEERPTVHDLRWWVLEYDRQRREDDTDLDATYQDMVRCARRLRQASGGEEPQWVDQPDEERCFTACLASLTGLPLDAFPSPPGRRNSKTEVEWHNALNRFLRANGWRLVKTWRDVPRGYAIATGPSPRRPGFDHCVVTLNGDIVHDPHPSRDGVPEITEYEVVVPIAPALPETEEGG